MRHHTRTMHSTVKLSSLCCQLCASCCNMVLKSLIDLLRCCLLNVNIGAGHPWTLVVTPQPTS